MFIELPDIVIGPVVICSQPVTGVGPAVCVIVGVGVFVGVWVGVNVGVKVGVRVGV